MITLNFDLYYIYNILMGIGDWGLGIGDWGLGRGPNPQAPIPKPQPPIPHPPTPTHYITYSSLTIHKFKNNNLFIEIYYRLIYLYIFILLI